MNPPCVKNMGPPCVKKILKFVPPVRQKISTPRASKNSLTGGVPELIPFRVDITDTWQLVEEIPDDGTKIWLDQRSDTEGVFYVEAEGTVAPFFRILENSNGAESVETNGPIPISVLYFCLSYWVLRASAPAERLPN